MEIRSLIETGKFNKSLEIELLTLMKKLQKLVDPQLKQKMINRLEIIINFQEYASKRRATEWEVMFSPKRFQKTYFSNIFFHSSFFFK